MGRGRDRMGRDEQAAHQPQAPPAQRDPPSELVEGSSRPWVPQRADCSNRSYFCCPPRWVDPGSLWVLLAQGNPGALVIAQQGHGDGEPLSPNPLHRAPVPIPGWKVWAVPLSHVLLLMKREPLKATKPRRRLGGSGVGAAMGSS